MANNDLNDINKRIEKLKIQKNILRANSEQNINRKQRTKRLIEKGALLEKYFEKNEIKGYIALETCLRVELYLEISKDFEFDNFMKEMKAENINIITYISP